MERKICYFQFKQNGQCPTPPGRWHPASVTAGAELVSLHCSHWHIQTYPIDSWWSGGIKM